MDISPAVRDRINSAAEALYEEAGRRIFPTVDAVRKLAKVNMNDASAGMRAWRRTQATQSSAPIVQVPSTLQQANATMLNSIWVEAVALASETLRAAQIGWDAERADADTLSEQMANAFEAQAVELATAQSEIERLQHEKAHLNDALTISQRREDEAVRDATAAHSATRQAETKAGEIERRADDLRKALDGFHAANVSASNEQAAMRRAHNDEVAGLRAELADTRQKAEHIETATRAELQHALEETATLRGKLDGLTETQAQANGRRNFSR